MTVAFASLSLLLVAPMAVVQQDPTAHEDHEVARELFEHHFTRGIRIAHQRGVGISAQESRLAFAELDRAAEFIPELAPDRRDRAAFGIAVRRAEVLIFGRQDSEAAEVLVAARDAALRAGVWDGRYRELADVLLWQIAPTQFVRVFDEEREFLASAEAQARAEIDRTVDPDALRAAKQRQVSLAAIRLGYELRDPVRVAAAERELAALADGLSERDEWRSMAFGILAWHFVEQRDLARAENYLARMPAELVRFPRALLALRRGDVDTALREGRALADLDLRYEHLYGEALEKAGDLLAARAAYDRALGGSLDSSERLVVRRSLAEVALLLWEHGGDPAELRTARDELERAIMVRDEAVRETESRSRYLEAESFQLSVLQGRIVEAEGDPRSAFRFYSRALDEVEALRGTAAASLFGGTLLELDELDAVEGVLRTQAAAGCTTLEVFAALERGKARTLLDWIYSPPEVVDPAAARELAVAVHELAINTSPQQLRSKLEELEERRLRATIAAHDVGAVPLDATAVRSHMAAWPGTLFLSYWMGRRSGWLVWSRGAELGGVVELGTRGELMAIAGEAVRAVRDARTPIDRTRERLASAARMFLPSCLAEHLGRVERIVFCPDEELGRLPFEALPIDASGKAVGVVHPVERAASLSVRDSIVTRRALGERVLVVHSVQGDAGVERALELTPLRFSAREARYVQRAHPGHVEQIAGTSASRAEFARLLAGGDCDIVQISAHAVVDPFVPTSSLIVLADGAHSVASLFDLRLDGALLVLSACGSATGRSRAGEGEVGLLGWPFAAGARGAVASMWSVNQQATADLMGQFHAAIGQGADPVEAMRSARAVLAAAPQYAHPHYWAGFGVFECSPPAYAQLASDGIALWLISLFAISMGAFGLLVLRPAPSR